MHFTLVFLFLCPATTLAASLCRESPELCRTPPPFVALHASLPSTVCGFLYSMVSMAGHTWLKRASNPPATKDAGSGQPTYFCIGQAQSLWMEKLYRGATMLYSEMRVPYQSSLNAAYNQ